MKKYSLWRDAFASLQLPKWYPDYEDERSRANSMEIITKAYVQLYVILSVAMILILGFFFVTAALWPDKDIRLIAVLDLIVSTTFSIITLTQYIALYRLAKQGLIRKNKSAGAMLPGFLLPLFCNNLRNGIFNLIFKGDAYYPWVLHIFIAFAVITFVMTIVLYKIINRVYNSAMNEGEET